MRDEVLLGDCREVLATLDDASIDAVVTDPPYALTQMSRGGSPRQNDPTKPYGRHRLADKGFMGQQWDNGRVAHDPAFWAEMLRVARPGAFLLAFGGTRTYHRLACAIEDAGWECRDMIMWLYGSGFPKSKSCLKPAQEPIVLAKAPGPLRPLQIDACRVATGGEVIARDFDAQQDSGYGYCRPTPARQGTWTNTAGRWPPNTLFSHHPDCQPAGVRRVRGAGWRDTDGAGGQKIAPGAVLGNRQSALPRPAGGHHIDADGCETVDAWTCVDGCPIKALDEQAGPRTSGAKALHHVRTTTKGKTAWGRGQGGGILRAPPEEHPASTGSASRFFPTFPGPDPEDAVPFRYQPKASRAEREAGLDGAESATKTIDGAGITSADHPGTADGGGPRAARNPHPCVKPRDLMAWLVTLVTVPGGIVLDPFCGSGSTGVACVRQGFGFIGIEMSEEYAAIARARIAHEQEQQTGPLFAGCAHSD